MDISVANVVFGNDGPSDGWSADIIVDSVVIGRAHSDRLGQLSIPGLSISDVELLDGYLAENGEPVRNLDGSTRTESFKDRLGDLVSQAYLEAEVQSMLRVAAFGLDHEDGKTLIFKVSVPEGGTLEDAMACLRRERPGATVLNELPSTEALLAYMQHAA